MIGEAQAVLGSSATALVGMENTSSSGQAANRGGVASRWLSPVLELAIQGEAARWPKAVEPGDSGADLSYGCGEPHVGRDAIAAMDFFTVPTITFGVLYCFFVISHERRKILHCNVTRNPATPLDRAADARSVALRVDAQILAL